MKLSYCLACKHFIGHKPGKSTPSCRAFDEIPPDILSGENNHKKKVTGDHGIRFEPIEEKAANA